MTRLKYLMTHLTITIHELYITLLVTGDDNVYK